MDEMFLNSSSQSETRVPTSDVETPLPRGQTGAAGVNVKIKNLKYNTPQTQLSPPPTNLILHKNDQRQNSQRFQFQQVNSKGSEVTMISSSSSNHNPTPSTNSNNSAMLFLGESHPSSVPTDQFYHSSSNNSPFQSAAEDPSPDDDGDGGQGHRNDDLDPLIFKGPPRQSVFHQFLSSAKGAVKGGSKDRNKTENGNGKVLVVNGSERKLNLGGGGKNAINIQKPRHEPNLVMSPQVQPNPQPEYEEELGQNYVSQPHPHDLEDGSSPPSEDEEDILQGHRGHRHSHPHRSKSDPHPNHSTRGSSCSIGILLASVSCVFFATSALIVKVSRLHPMELLCVRGALQALFISPILLSSGNSFLGPSGSRALLLSRAVLGAVSLIMSFASIHLIPLADAATCIFTSPVFVSLFACICLRELCSWFDVVMILLTLLGVVLVSQPSFHFLNAFTTPTGDSSGLGSYSSILGTICGLAAAMLTALAFIVLRQLKHVHYSVVVFWFSAVLAGFGGVLMVALDGFRLPSDGWDIIDCVGIGICGFLGQILLTKALQIENAGPCAVARTLDIVLAFFYQITLLHDTPDWSSYLGSFLVVSCVLLTAFRRWYREKYGLDREGQEGSNGQGRGRGRDGGRGHDGALMGVGSRRGEKLRCGSGSGGINNRNCSYSRANTGIS